MIKQVMRIGLVSVFGILSVLPGWAGLSQRLEANLERKIASSNPPKVESSFDYALDVKIRISQPDGGERTFSRPGVVVGQKHIMMYLGELQKGEIIRLIQVEKRFTVFNFKASYNNVWVSEQELYRAFDTYNTSRLSHIILLLPLQEPIGNFAYGVFGMNQAEPHFQTDFLSGVDYALARRTNILNVWDKLVTVTIGQVVKSVSGVPYYHTSSARWVQREGNPLFVHFHKANAFGMPTTWVMLVGFKISGENVYRGFSHTHMQQGRRLAPDVTWFEH